MEPTLSLTHKRWAIRNHIALAGVGVRFERASRSWLLRRVAVARFGFWARFATKHRQYEVGAEARLIVYECTLRAGLAVKIAGVKGVRRNACGASKRAIRRC